MKTNYQIITDATADLSDEMMDGLPEVTVIPMPVRVGGTDYTFGPGGNLTAAQFYDLQREGLFASTAGINPFTYIEYFEPILRAGKDILYLCFSSGLSGMIQSAALCIDELCEQYPDRKIVCIDTLCASVGEGFLVREAARKQAEGLSIEELAEWTGRHRLEVCHWFMVDTLGHLLHGGRIRPVAAAAGSILQVKPLLHVDTDGKLTVAALLRSRNRAISAQIAKMEQGWKREQGNLVIIGHGDCAEGAALLQKRVAELFLDAEIHIAEIGPVIGAHTGPGMLALIFWGNLR